MNEDMLVMPFLTHDPVWVRGFEAGRLFQWMCEGSPRITGTFHSANQEQIFLMASRLNYACEWKQTTEGFVDMVLTRKEPFYG